MYQFAWNNSTCLIRWNKEQLEGETEHGREAVTWWDEGQVSDDASPHGTQALT